MQADYLSEARQAVCELCEAAKLRTGQLVVIGCSTSEIVGQKIGSDSRPEVAEALFAVLHEELPARGTWLAAQCCEHLNRALVVEAEALPDAAGVNAVPQPKAGGSFAAAAYKAFRQPIVVETVRRTQGWISAAR